MTNLTINLKDGSSFTLDDNQKITILSFDGNLIKIQFEYKNIIFEKDNFESYVLDYRFPTSCLNINNLIIILTNILVSRK